MKITAKAKDCRLLVKVKLAKQEPLDEKELDRFSRIYLRGFLKPSTVSKNQVEYAGPIGISLYERLKKPISKRDFYFILEHIVVSVMKLRGNGMQLGFLKMDTRHIYMNETTKELQFLYVPAVSVEQTPSILELFESVIYSTVPMQEPDMEYVSRFAYFFRGLKPFDIAKVEQFIQREDRSVVNTIKKNNVGQSGFMTCKPADYLEHYSEQESQAPEVEPVVQQANFTPMVGAEDEATGLLQEAPAPAPWVAPEPAAWTPSADAWGEATGLLQEDPAPAPRVAPEPAAWTPSADAWGEATGLLQEDPAPAPWAAPEPAVWTPTADAWGEATGLLQEDPAPAPWVAPEPESAPRLAPEPVQEDDGGTMLLVDNAPAGAAVVQPELFRILTRETISVNKPVFRVGKERSYVDYFVSNNNAVSRSHADIITRGSSYFVVDLNSKNGTYINNSPLSAQQEYPIRSGDSLRLGNEEFLFRAVTKDTKERICPNCRKQVAADSNFCTFCGSRIN